MQNEELNGAHPNFAQVQTLVDFNLNLALWLHCKIEPVLNVFNWQREM